MTYFMPQLSPQKKAESCTDLSNFHYQLHRDYPLNDFVTSLDLSPMNNALVRVTGINGKTQYIVASMMKQASTNFWGYYFTQVWGRDAIADAQTLATTGPKFNAVLLVNDPIDAIECTEGARAPVECTIAVLANDYFDFIMEVKKRPLPERFPPLSNQERRVICAPGSDSRTRQHDFGTGKLVEYSTNPKFAFYKAGYGPVVKPVKTTVQDSPAPESTKGTNGKTE